MKWYEKLEGMFNPYSLNGLKYRASKLPDCPYKVLLELTIIQLEAKKLNELEAKKAIEYFRSGNKELLVVGFKILNLSDEQINEALALLKTGTIKEINQK